MAVSDLFGRLAVFQLTLCFSALFGFFAFYVDTFPVLCFANFLLGTAVGVRPPLTIATISYHTNIGIHANRWDLCLGNSPPK